MSEINEEETEAYRESLLNKLEQLGNGSRWIWITFILCLTPSILNGFHTSSYVFLGQMPDNYWCTIPELDKWTTEQMQNFSAAHSKCKIYDYDYRIFSNLSYEEAVDMISSMPKPKELNCGQHGNSYFSYDQQKSVSIVTEWDLVCDRLVYRTNVQMALSVGKFFGSSLLGVIADRWGRKLAFNISAVIYMVAGLVSFLTPWYWIFFLSRFLLGMAGSGVYNSAYTLLTESVAKKHRSWTSVVYSISYPIGSLLLALIAYLVPEWRNLQMCLTLPGFLLIIHCIYLDESPRWLMNKNEFDKAHKIIFKGTKRPKVSSASLKIAKMERKTFKERLRLSFRELSLLYGKSSIIRNRLFVCQLAWFVSSFSYYVIALNADNFSANRYIYIALVGIFEIPSCIVPIVILKVFGRRSTSLILFYAAGMSLLILFAVPTDETTLITFIAMFGRFCIGAVYIVVILHTAELFPTEVRNSAIGTSSAMSHIGSISAPYVVDFLGIIAWFIPTTICAVTAIGAGTLVMFLPETKGKDLHDKIEEQNPETVEL
ncbi:organic cation transporter protein [Culicoides brevitarsis]|uniref:organic cation transporter protein n=1 Tax=Culicoides brevitarsis TaxID=469753 RepID=UPI00307BF6CA